MQGRGLGRRANSTREVILVRLIRRSVELVPRLGGDGRQVLIHSPPPSSVKGRGHVAQLGDLQICRVMIVCLSLAL